MPSRNSEHKQQHHRQAERADIVLFFNLCQRRRRRDARLTESFTAGMFIIAMHALVEQEREMFVAQRTNIGSVAMTTRAGRRYESAWLLAQPITVSRPATRFRDR